MYFPVMRLVYSSGYSTFRVVSEVVIESCLTSYVHTKF